MLWSGESPNQGDWAVQFDKMHRLVRLILWVAIAGVAWLTVRRLSALMMSGNGAVNAQHSQAGSRRAQ
jgi:hypothetical protein